MTCAIYFSPRVLRALESELPEPVAAACVEFILGPLADDPRRAGKPLRGELPGLFSARRGEYRVIYEIHHQRVTVRVIFVCHRRDASRKELLCRKLEGDSPRSEETTTEENWRRSGEIFADLADPVVMADAWR